MARTNLMPGVCRSCLQEVPARTGVLRRHPGAPGRDTYGLAIVLCKSCDNARKRDRAGAGREKTKQHVSQ